MRKFPTSSATAVAVLVGLLAACGADDAANPQAKPQQQDLQETPGELVVQSRDQKLLVEWRQTDKTLQLQAEEKEGVNAYGERQQALCLSLRDNANGWAFLQSSVAELCPEVESEAYPNNRSTLSTHALQSRNAAVVRMARAAAATPSPPGQEQMWRQVQRYLADFAATVDRLAQGKTALLQPSAGAPTADDQVTASLGRPADTELESLRPQQLEQRNSFRPLFGPVVDWFARKKSPHQRVEDAALEFKQEVSLYGKKTKKYLFFGEPGDMDHTGAHIVVKSRPLGSDNAWQLHAQTYTQNHGSHPLDPQMQLYETCDDLPVTRGYFAWKGECPGRWGDEHLCNDDTRYQLWHAYGGWSDVASCPVMFSSIRPTCRKPW